MRHANFNSPSDEAPSPGADGFWRRLGNRRGFGPFDLIGLALALGFFALLVVPLLTMLWSVFFGNASLTWALVVETFSDRGLLNVMRSTAAVVGASCVAAMIIAVTFAWLNERTDASIGWVSRILPFMPLLLPPIALSIGWFFLAHERAGILNVAMRAILSWFGIEIGATGPLSITTWQGLVFVYTLYLVPSAYLIAAATFHNMDPALEEASWVSGAGHWRTFRKVSLPAVLPGLAAAGLLVAINGISQFSIPVTIGTAARIDVLSVRMVSLVRNYPPNIDEAVLLSAFVMLVVGVLWAVQVYIGSRARHSVIGGKSSRANVVRLGVWKWPARLTMILYLLATSILPLAMLMLVSLQRFWQPVPIWSRLTFANFDALFFGTGMASRALLNSFLLASVGATLGILLATVLMLYVQQRGNTLFGRFVDASTKAPGAIPHIVIGMAFIVALAGPPFNLGGTLLLLLLAYIVIYMPQGAVSAGSGINQIGKELHEASAVFGASRGRTFRRIVLPLLRPSLAAGWALLFVVMLGDLTASALIAQGSNPVVGFVIYDIWDNGTFSQLATIATAVGVVSFAAVSMVLIFARQRRD
jgi:iron(III) transport system permease protein